MEKIEYNGVMHNDYNCMKFTSPQEIRPFTQRQGKLIPLDKRVTENIWV